MLIGGLWSLKFLGGFTDDILEVRPNPVRVNEWKPKKPVTQTQEMRQERFG